MSRLCAGLVIAAAACAFAGQAVALSPSFAMLVELDNISVTASPLDASDPAIPAIELPSFYVNTYLRTNTVRKTVEQVGQEWWQPATYSAADGPAASTASWQDKTLRLTANSNDGSHFGAMTVHGEFFTLRPNTLLTVEADARVRGTARDVYLNPDFKQLATLNTYLSLASGTGSQQQVHEDATDKLEYTLFAQNNDGGLLSFDLRRHLSVSFKNPTGVFDLALNISGMQPVTPVPEPETYALMLAGLLVVGAEIRRRRKKGTEECTPESEQDRVAA